MGRGRKGGWRGGKVERLDGRERGGVERREGKAERLDEWGEGERGGGEGGRWRGWMGGREGGWRGERERQRG